MVRVSLGALGPKQTLIGSLGVGPRVFPEGGSLASWSRDVLNTLPGTGVLPVARATSVKFIVLSLLYTNFPGYREVYAKSTCPSFCKVVLACGGVCNLHGFGMLGPCNCFGGQRWQNVSTSLETRLALAELAVSEVHCRTDHGPCCWKASRLAVPASVDLYHCIEGCMF